MRIRLPSVCLIVTLALACSAARADDASATSASPTAVGDASSDATPSDDGDAAFSSGEDGPGQGGAIACGGALCDTTNNSACAVTVGVGARSRAGVSWLTIALAGASIAMIFRRRYGTYRLKSEVGRVRNRPASQRI